MANPNPATTFELLQLLTVLGVQIENSDSLARLSPTFLESRIQTYLGFTQPGVVAGSQSKIAISGTEDVRKVDLKAYETAAIHGGAHDHGHTHGGEPCGGHGEENDHGHSHGGGNDHGHSHGDNDHGHSHDGNDHGHSHGGPASVDHGHGHEDDNSHGHTHDGEPCGGHDDDDDGEEEDEEDEDHEGPQINQVLRALRHYISILTSGIQQAWAKPPLFPGAPRRNIWVLREPTRDGKPAPTNLGHDLVLTIAGASTISGEDGSVIPVILLNYALDSPAARKGLWGDTMQMNLPREILHLLEVLLEGNSRKCPSFKAVEEAQVGTSSSGFKPTFLAPVSEEHPDEEKITKLDIKKDALEKLTGCDVCQLLGPDLKCAKCKVRTYCSAVCQRKDWKEHKASCVPVA